MEFGVDINARNKSGKTPLHLAVSSLADGVFNLLIRNRACQIDVQDYEGNYNQLSYCICYPKLLIKSISQTKGFVDFQYMNLFPIAHTEGLGDPNR